ncbi:MAG: T9SS type A sorting domain-containing protein [Ferruginibacter sp.]
MKKKLHAIFILACFLFSLLFYQPVKSQSRVDVGKSFANISKLATGGTFNPGDTIEVRVTIAVKTVATYTAIDSVQVFDNVPAKTTYINGSLRIATNQGLTYKGPFTEALDADQASNVGGAITINLGKWANGTKGGRIRSDTSKPSFYNSHCIMMACYKVRINAATAYGDSISFGGSIRYKTVTPANGWTITNFPTYKILIFAYSGSCVNGSAVSAASDFSGTFGTGKFQNRPAALAFTTTYVKQNMSTGQPNDYNYAIVNNSSADGSINPNSTMPESPALHRVFGLWDIGGDHTSSANPGIGNPPVLPGITGGYYVLVNASYNTDVAYQETLSNLCPSTYYEFSAWYRNVCPRCSCDSNGRGSGTAGFLPYPANDSSGVRPNLTFEIDGLAYYTTGDIKYDRVTPWKRYGFTFMTKPTQNTANFVIRNNSPGGGGNDWAIDDIKIAYCGPSLTMNYNPIVLGCQANPFVVNLRDTVRSVYNNYTYFKWQKSNVGGTIWSDMTGPGTSGVGTPVLVGGLYQYVTALPPFLAYLADSGTYYRVIVGTTAANLTGNCAYNDGSATMVKVINCGIILNTNFSQFRGQLVNKRSYLTWSALAEQNLNKYEIEKSTDGISFNKIAAINPRNIAEAYYNYTDPEMIINNTYYRLKMIDNDDLFKYSTVILLSPDLKFEVRPLKNPFRNNITAEVIIPEDGILDLKIYNDKGQLVRTTQQAGRKGLNSISIENINSAEGIYFLSVNFKNETIKSKLIKIN